tara:strand:- start:1889 stop:3229 length:1341 start_codon:yes stop_codon:yes gene_type:complete
MESYEEKQERLTAKLRQNQPGPVRLEKSTSNLFRHRGGSGAQKLDVTNFNNVIRVDSVNQIVETEGMTTYATLVDATLREGCMPAIVPQLKSITIGGAVSGVGIESSSFQHGLVHETVTEMDVLLGDGEIINCTASNEHKNLFFGLPNSYGTLGYILKLKARTIPVKPYVHIRHIRVTDSEKFFSEIDHWCSERVDFIDGAVFEKGEHYLTVGKFVDVAPYVSDYTYLNIFYRSIQEKNEDYLTVKDYLWRWDTDWFWCSRNLCAENPIVRRILGRKRLNSITYQKVMRWNTRVGMTRIINKYLGVHTESVIQDVDIPIQNAPRFLDFFHREIGMRPIWICPVSHPNTGLQNNYPLFPLNPATRYINFGFWGVIRGQEKLSEGYYNRKIEKMVAELHGIKSLYSSSYYPEEEFWGLYNGNKYQSLKQRYDPDARLHNLYQKSVLRQ